MGVDPLTANRYSYVNGDPVNFIDPDGHEACYAQDKDVCNYYYTGEAGPDGRWAKAAERHRKSQPKPLQPSKPKKCNTWCKMRREAGNFATGFGEGVKEMGKSAVELGKLGLNCSPALGRVSGCEQVLAIGKELVTDPVNFVESAAKDAVAYEEFTGGETAKGAGKLAPSIITAILTKGASRVLKVPKNAPDGNGRPAAATGGGRSRAPADCRANSFVPATLVLMANGSAKPIGEVAVGDLVMAAEPETGERGPRAVTDTIVGHGLKQLVEVEVDGELVVATAGHPFWVASEGRWLDADELRPGQRLARADGTTVAVRSVAARTGSAQTVHNLTVDGIHTYFVFAGTTAVLVHNCGETAPARAADEVADAPDRPTFVGFEEGPAAIVPAGATGPLRTKGPGMQFVGGQGGHGLHDRVTSLRIMDAHAQHNRRLMYMKEKQKLHPYTGGTISDDHEWAHMPW